MVFEYVNGTWNRISTKRLPRRPPSWRVRPDRHPPQPRLPAKPPPGPPPPRLPEYLRPDGAIYIITPLADTVPADRRDITPVEDELALAAAGWTTPHRFDVDGLAVLVLRSPAAEPVSWSPISSTACCSAYQCTASGNYPAFIRQ